MDARARHPADLGYAEASGSFNRCADRRHDAAFLAAEATSPQRRTLLFAGDRPVLRAGVDGALDVLFDAAAVDAAGPVERAVYLGRDAGGPRFAADLASGAEAALERADALLVEDLRGLATDGRLAGADLALVGYGRSLLSWHARHGFCATCGEPTAMAAGGWRRECAACGAQHFPRVDPVVIMLVTHGDRCLLGRQHRFAPGMWSCLAGFVEPGETIEQAVARETFEEAGVRVDRVAYAFCQPWPFPSQLMLGMTAEAQGDAIVRDESELEDARWFSRDAAAAMLSRTHAGGLTAPPPAAIAHHLLRLFVEAG